MSKQYADPSTYETKLKKVMARLDVDEYDYNWDRFSCWVDFVYKSEHYRFSHSVDNAKAHGVNIKCGSDTFAQVVLSLEDLARMVERGIYDLSSWVTGMKYLPTTKELPIFFQVLQFSRIPNGIDDIEKQFRHLAKSSHPDVGGTDEQFQVLQNAREQAIEYLRNINN